MTLPIITLTLSILFNFILHHLYRRHYRHELNRRDESIRTLQSCIRNDHIYIQELQRRLARKWPRFGLARTCPKFSDYDICQGDMIVSQSRIWWN